MTPTAVAKVFADLDKHERVLRRAFDQDPSGGLFDVHRKVAGARNFDLLTSDAATMLAGVGEHPMVADLLERPAKLMDQAALGFTDPFEEHRVGRALRQRDEVEQRLMRAGGAGTLMHELGHSGSRPVPKGGGADFLGVPRRTRDLNEPGPFPGADAALAHDVGHFVFPETASNSPARLTGPPALKTPVVDLPPIIVPKRGRAQLFGPAIVPADLAEAGAAEETRSNKIAVEAILRDNNLDYEREHLDLIAVCLASDTEAERIHAAMSANLLFEGVANFVFPGREAGHVDRDGKERSVEKKDVRNRISAFIDIHLREEISAHEAKRLQAKIDYAHNWSAEGHHVPGSSESANRAYRDMLEVLAYVARARERSAR